MLSEAHIHRIYAQSVDAILCLIRRLEGQIEDMEVQLIRSPQPVMVAAPSLASGHLFRADNHVLAGSEPA